MVVEIIVFGINIPFSNKFQRYFNLFIISFSLVNIFDVHVVLHVINTFSLTIYTNDIKLSIF